MPPACCRRRAPCRATSASSRWTCTFRRSTSIRPSWVRCIVLPHGPRAAVPPAHSLCVAATREERADNVGAGKYTIGLGQRRMCFVEDNEDIHSFALTGAARWS
jgi:hypothetical protein